MSGGKLLLIGTPIGNLSDLSARALEALRSADLLLCEDTRHTRKLLDHYGITVAVESFHDHNEDDKAAKIAERIRGGARIGLVSDAGLPLLSDPGYALVRLAREEGLTVEPISGPFAAALAVISSGLPPLPFLFAGFAPHRSGERRDFYLKFRGFDATLAVYESPHRLIESLRDALEVIGDVPMTMAREMTKMHEEFLHGLISAVIRQLETRDMIRGEVTVVFDLRDRTVAARPSTEKLREEFGRLRDDGMRRNDATRMLADRYGLSRKELYKLLLATDS